MILPPVRGVEAHVAPVSPKTTWIVLEISFADGPSGWGEATLAGAERLILQEIASASARLSGARLAGDRAAMAMLPDEPASPVRNVVRRAVEQAVMDAVARRLDVPLATLLGGARRSSVPVYANINRGLDDRSPAAFAARARQVVAEDSYDAVKIAPFDGLHWARAAPAESKRLLEAGIARMAAVREAIGPDAGLLVDCHWRLSPAMARTVLRACEPLGLYWLEDALDEDAHDASTARSLRGFANDRGVLIAGGELVDGVPRACALLGRGAWDVMLPDLRWTGLRSGQTILDLAVASGVAASLHNPVGPVLDRFSLQLALVQPEFLILERQVRESPLFDAILPSCLRLQAGQLLDPGEVGAGLEPKRDSFSRLGET